MLTVLGQRVFVDATKRFYPQQEIRSRITHTDARMNRTKAHMHTCTYTTYTHTRLIIRTYYSDLEARARSLQLEVDERACSKYVCVDDF